MTVAPPASRIDSAFKALGALPQRKLMEAVVSAGECSFQHLLEVDGGHRSTVAKRVRILCASGLLSDDLSKAQDRYRVGPAIKETSDWFEGLRLRVAPHGASTQPLQPLLVALRPTTNRMVIESLIRKQSQENQAVARDIGRTDAAVSRATAQMLVAGLISKARRDFGVSLDVNQDVLERAWAWFRNPNRDPERVR